MYHYAPLKTHLESQATAAVSMTFEEVERLIGRPLPPSARGRHSRQWWANSDSHSQAKAWLSVGRKAKLSGDRSVVFIKVADVAPPASTPPSELGAPLAGLNMAARRLVDDVAEENSLTPEEAAARILNQVALQRRRRTLDWFGENTVMSSVTSADLLRAERDAH